MAYFDLTISSRSIGRQTNVGVILPQKGYEEFFESTAQPGKCKVLYLLHGLSDCYNDWHRYTAIERYARERGIAVVMPDADRSFYTNLPHGRNYYDYVAKELPAIMESMFPISSAREDRFIAGNSMGGYGALKIALREDGAFAAAAPLSPVGDIAAHIGQESWDDYHIVFGEDRCVRDEDNILLLAEKCKVRPRVWLGIGRDDYLYENDKAVCRKLTELGYDFTFHDTNGPHTWYVWDELIEKALVWMLGK